MRILVKFLFGLGAFVLPAVSAANEDLPLKMKVISRINDAQLDLFFARMKHFDFEGRVDTEARPDDVDDIDVFLFVVSEWSDVVALPLQDAFGSAYDAVRSFSDETHISSGTIDFKDGTSYLLIFYSEANAPSSDFNCVVKEVLQIIYPHRVPHFTCS